MDLRLRRGLLWLLAFILLLTVARQVLDFLGKLWLPILLNFLHIVAVIVALFGALQFRIRFLLAFAAWILPWAAWNAFLICFYLGLGALDRNSLILGFGLRGSRSFWVENTPLCQSSYDYTRLAWVVAEDCYLPFHWVEVIVAIVHLALALLSLAVSLAFACQFSRTWQAEKKATQPRVTVEFTEPHHSHYANGVSREPAAKRNPGYVSDSSGYINTSFEPNSPSPLARQQDYLPKLGDNGQLVQKNPRRSSKKKKRRPPPDETTSEVIYGDFSAQPRSLDQFSIAATAEVTDGGRRTRGSSSTRESREAKAARRRDRNARSVSPGTRRHHGSLNALQALPPPPQPMAPPSYVPAYRPRGSSRTRPYKHYNGQSASQPDILGNGTTAKNDPEGHILSYHNEPRRISVEEPRSVADPKPLTSLISFDPKSDQTLIRYQDHLARSREVLQSSRTDESGDSPPLQMAPSMATALPPYQKRFYQSGHQSRGFQPTAVQSDRTSYDSGIPSSVGHGGSSEGSTSSQPSTRSTDLATPTGLVNGFRAGLAKADPANYYEPPSHSRCGSGALPPPPPLAPVRDGVVMAMDLNCSLDSTFSIPPPPPPAQKPPTAFFLPPLSAQLSNRLQASTDDLRQPHRTQTSPALQSGPNSGFRAQSGRTSYDSAIPSAGHQPSYARYQHPPPPPVRHSPRLQHQNSLLV